MDFYTKSAFKTGNQTPLNLRSFFLFFFIPSQDAVKPVETKLAIPGKEMDKPSDALSARSLEKQLLPPVSCGKINLASLFDLILCMPILSSLRIKKL